MLKFVLKLAKVLFVKLAESLTNVCSSHNFLKHFVFILFLVSLLSGSHSQQLEADILVHVETRVNQILQEEVAFHHVGELAMAVELNINCLDLGKFGSEIRQVHGTV